MEIAFCNTEEEKKSLLKHNYLPEKAGSFQALDNCACFGESEIVLAEIQIGRDFRLGI